MKWSILKASITPCISPLSWPDIIGGGGVVLVIAAVLQFFSSQNQQHPVFYKFTIPRNTEIRNTTNNRGGGGRGESAEPNKTLLWFVGEDLSFCGVPMILIFLLGLIWQISPNALFKSSNITKPKSLLGLGRLELDERRQSKKGNCGNSCIEHHNKTSGVWHGSNRRHRVGPSP